MECKYCGTKIEEEWNYCPYCMTQQKENVDTEEIKKIIAEYKTSQEEKNVGTDNNRKMSFDRATFLIAIIIMMSSAIFYIIIKALPLSETTKVGYIYMIRPIGISIFGIAALIMSKREYTFVILSIVLGVFIVVETLFGFIMGALCGDFTCVG
ncbi:MAG: zinc ribbon domain-containing protein [Clostridia bacterium]|nr:zinc ribbon domain-containing protein [Clostridia bacterium]